MAASVQASFASKSSSATRSAASRHPVAGGPSTGHPASTRPDLEALHTLQRIAIEDPAFAQDLRFAGSTQQAADFAQRWGIDVSPEALWRNRGRHGLPTWRG